MGRTIASVSGLGLMGGGWGGYPMGDPRIAGRRGALNPRDQAFDRRTHRLQDTFGINAHTQHDSGDRSEQRPEEHTSELKSLMTISYEVFRCNTQQTDIQE